MDYRVRILFCTLLFVWNAVAEGDDMAGVLTEDSDGPAPPIMDINQKPPGSVKVVTPPMTNQNGTSDAVEAPKLLGSVKGLPKHSTQKSSEVGSQPAPVALALTHSKSAVPDQKVALSNPNIVPAEAKTPLALNTSSPEKEIVESVYTGSVNVTGQTSTSTLGTKPAENEVEEVKEAEKKEKEEGTEEKKGSGKEEKKEGSEKKEKEEKKEGEEDLAEEKEKEGDAVDPAVQEAKNMEVAEKEFEEDNDGADDDDTKNDKKEKVEVVKEDKKEKETTRRPYPFIPDQFIREESTDSHFMMWMMLFGTIVLISYVVVHNKKKVLGLMFEGRTGGGGRRGRGNVRYRPLSQTEHENVIY